MEPFRLARELLVEHPGFQHDRRRGLHRRNRSRHEPSSPPPDNWRPGPARPRAPMSPPAGSNPPRPGRATVTSREPSVSPPSRSPDPTTPISPPNTGASPPGADPSRRSSPWNTPCSPPPGTCSPPASSTGTRAPTTSPAAHPAKTKGPRDRTTRIPRLQSHHRTTDGNRVDAPARTTCRSDFIFIQDANRSRNSRLRILFVHSELSAQGCVNGTAKPPFPTNRHK